MFEIFEFLDFSLNLNLVCDLDQPRISNSKSADVASLVGDYCSLIIRASQLGPLSELCYVMCPGKRGKTSPCYSIVPPLGMVK